MSRAFKSSGKTRSKVEQEAAAVTTSQLPIGILTPLQTGDRKNGTLRMSWDIKDQINDNLRNLILTNWGERLGNYYFGANIKELATESVNQENFDNVAMNRISEAVSKWMPYVNLLSFNSNITTSNNITGKITINLTYNVPSVKQEEERSLSVDLYII